MTLSQLRQPDIGPRPLGLKLLVIYKSISAVVLLILSIALSLAWIHLREVNLAEFTVQSQMVVAIWLAENLAKLPPHTLGLAGAAAGIYSLISGIEAIGLWYEKGWARWLILIGVGLSLPFELYEVVRAPSPLRLAILLANSLAFWYVLRRFPHHP